MGENRVPVGRGGGPIYGVTAQRHGTRVAHVLDALLGSPRGLVRCAGGNRAAELAESGVRGRTPVQSMHAGAWSAWTGLGGDYDHIDDRR